jgi:Rieske Fe-S protein
MAVKHNKKLNMSTNPGYERRQLLAQLVKLLSMIGLIALAWVFVASLTSTQQTEDKKMTRGIEVNVSQLKPGQLRKLSLGHKEVWVYHRSSEDVEQLKKDNPDLRSQHDNYFVFFPYEPKRQCLVNWDANNRSFYDTCNARHFDQAGRLAGNKGSLQVQLTVPEHHFVSEQVIQIDAR